MTLSPDLLPPRDPPTVRSFVGGVLMLSLLFVGMVAVDYPLVAVALLVFGNGAVRLARRISRRQ